MPDYVDIYTPEYTTCCGWHVRKMASFIGYLSLTLATMALCFVAISVAISVEYVFYLPAFIVMTFCHLFLIFAGIKEEPGYYIPYLVLEAINIITIPFVIIFFIFIFHQSNDSNSLFHNFGMGSLAESSTQFPIFSNKNYDSFSSMVRTQDETNKSMKNASEILQMIFILYIILLVVVGIIKVYFWIIVMKAKKYMEKEICTGNVRRQEFIVQMQPIVVVQNK